MIARQPAARTRNSFVRRWCLGPHLESGRDILAVEGDYE